MVVSCLIPLEEKDCLRAVLVYSPPLSDLKQVICLPSAFSFREMKSLLG